MSPHQELEIDLAHWVDTLGYHAVLDALRDICRDWATMPDDEAPSPVPACPPARWAQRDRALLHAQREDLR